MFYKYNSKISERIINPSIIGNKDFNENYISHLDIFYKKQILNFMNTLSSKYKDWDFSLLNSNLSTLEFKILPKYQLYNKAFAYYDWNSNTIYYKEGHEDAIFHELLHVSTFVNKDKFHFCGFEQYKSGIFKHSIGRGFNEGYTSLIENRLFNLPSNYNTEIPLVENIEIIIDKDLVKMYNHADLPSLINALSLYSSKDEVIDFLSKIDFINSYVFLYSYRLHNECASLYTECLLYTFKCYINKLLNLLENKSISKEMANVLITDMISFSPTEMLTYTGIRHLNLIEDLRRNIPDISNITSEDIKRYKLSI